MNKGGLFWKVIPSISTFKDRSTKYQKSILRSKRPKLVLLQQSEKQYYASNALSLFLSDYYANEMGLKGNASFSAKKGLSIFQFEMKFEAKLELSNFFTRPTMLSLTTIWILIKSKLIKNQINYGKLTRNVRTQITTFWQ